MGVSYQAVRIAVKKSTAMASPDYISVLCLKMLQLALLNRFPFGKFNRASAFAIVRRRRTGLASELQQNGITSLHFESAAGGLQGASL